MRFLSYVLLIGFLSFLGCSQNETKTDDSNSVEKSSEEQSLSTSQSGKKYESGSEGRTTSGYRYQFHVSNNGVRPQVGDQVQYHEITFKNDSLVNSTYYRLEPTLAVIPSLSEIPNPPPPNYEGVLMMSPGDSITVYHDLDTMAIEDLPKWLKPTDVLRYDIKMLTHKPKSVIEAGINATKARVQTVGDSLRTAIQEFKGGKLKNAKKTDSGITYIIHETGSGDALEEGKYLQVHYMGMLQENGISFNNTYGVAKPFAFQIGRGRVIKGWDEALLKLKKGGKMTIFIPYKMGYGEAGRPGKEGEPAYIPERADLAFYVELLDIR